MGKDEPKRRRSWGRLFFLWSTQLLVFWAFWLIYVSSVAVPELLIGVVAAALAATGSHLVWRNGLAQVAGHWRWFAQAWRLPWYVLSGTGQILMVLARQLFLRMPAESLLFKVPFDVGGDDADSATRRALAIAYSTVTPGSIVVGIDNESRTLLIHQITHAPVSQMTKNLGAKA